MSVASLLRRTGIGTCRIAAYRRGAATIGDLGQQILEWEPVVDDAPFYIQLGPGRVEPSPLGDVAEGRYPAYGESGIGLIQGDGIQVIASDDPNELYRRFEVERAKDWGRGGWQGELKESDEDFGAEPAS